MRNVIIMAVLVGCVLQSLSAQKPLSAQAEAYLMYEALRKYHIQPPAVDDAFSREIFNATLETLDPDKILFTEADIAALSIHKTSLDDELKGKRWAFLDQLLPVYKKALTRAIACIEREASSPVTQNYSVLYHPDTASWPHDETALQVKRSQYFRFLVLTRLADVFLQEASPAADFFVKHEPAARQRVKAQQLRAVNRALQHPNGFQTAVQGIYFQVVCSLFDPHTAFLNRTELENMVGSLSTEGYYFGVSLDENKKGDVIIAALTPGSPAWRCGELQPSDVIIGLRWKGQQLMDMEGVSLEEANEILLDANHETIEFTVQKPSGSIRKVLLKKEKISMEENMVRSFLLQGTATVGYISLPDFYTQWDEASEGSRCANDMAREILKLKVSDIKALILDLRGNSGGSMQEALAMAGIFINEGPLAISHNESGALTTLRDMNRGLVYDGPLIVLVNSMSASAAELLAGVLQDYNRALIVGETTYGKGTMQSFFPLIESDQPVDFNKVTGSMLKITVDRFYRITGKSIQSKGIQPDIVLPGLFTAINFYDAMLPHALPPDSVFKNTYFRPLPALPVSTLRQASLVRLQNHSGFRAVETWSHWLGQRVLSETKPYEISWKQTLTDLRDEDQRYATLDSIMNSQPVPFNVVLNDADTLRAQQDEYLSLFNKNWITHLLQDIYIAEAYAIACDWLRETNR